MDRINNMMHLMKDKTSNRRKSLFYIYLKHIIWLGISILIELFSFLIIINLQMNAGVLLKASYAENYLASYRQDIMNGADLSSMNFPNNCRYGIFSEKNELIEGNLNENQIKKAETYLISNNTSGSYIYDINRDDGRCLIFFDVAIHFSDPQWNAAIPNVELVLWVTFIVIFLLLITRNVYTFGKKLKMELRPLVEEIRLIGGKDISFERKSSQIKEFDQVLDATYQMKTALEESVKQQWAAEQLRKTNISALAHDIKTPLTIIKGNAQLIAEEEELDEIYDLAGGVNQNADKIENYLTLLMQEMRSNQNTEQSIQITVQQFYQELDEEIRQLCKSSQILVKSEIERDRESDNLSVKSQDELINMNSIYKRKIVVQQDLINRAVLNIVRNAIRYTDVERGITVGYKFTVQRMLPDKNNLNHITDSLNLCITVEDYGKGFSSEALAHATDRLYTEDKERNGKHYGLGLYLVNSVAKQYNGKIILQNKKEENGAIVKMIISI